MILFRFKAQIISGVTLAVAFREKRTTRKEASESTNKKKKCGKILAHK